MILLNQDPCPEDLALSALTSGRPQKENIMYYLIVGLLMFVLPIGSILVELFAFKSTQALMPLIGKWFVFWGVGGRLFLAGLRQAIQPRFTAEAILGIKCKESLQVVQELGFANISIGAIGIVSIFSGSWVMPSAIAGCLFCGLAGGRHVVKSKRNTVEDTALVSDLFIFVVLLLYIVVQVVSPQ
jgi:hypothetical protein